MLEHLASYNCLIKVCVGNSLILTTAIRLLKIIVEIWENKIGYILKLWFEI